MTETQSAPSALGATLAPAPRPRHLLAASTIILAEALMLLLFGAYYIGRSSIGVTIFCLIGTGVLVYGAMRVRRDPAVPGVEPVDSAGFRRVPWDWTDFLMFWPAAFAAGTLITSLIVPIADQLTAASDQTVQTTVRSAIEQTGSYAGALFNIYVLAGLRRGANLEDVGWRRFSWWWVLIAVGAAVVTLYAAEYLQVVSQRLFPSAQNTQCVAVQHQYGHFLPVAVIIVCVVAPLAEETVFRGFVYGWLQRWAPTALAVPLSAAIFSALHGVLLLFIPLFAVGCVLALIFHFSRSLWPGALVHSLFNLPGIIAILYAASC